MKAEIAILGGGLAGWALALALLRRGFDPDGLVLLEARSPGSGASGVPWALLHPVPGRSLAPRPGYLAAWTRSLAWLDSLAPAEDAMRRLPLRRLALDAATAGRFQRSFERAATEPDYPLRRLDPALWPGAEALYELAEGRLVAMPALLGRLRGLTGLQPRCQTGELRPVRDGAVWRLHTPDGEITAPRLVLATGAGLSGSFIGLGLARSYGEVASFRLRPDPDLGTIVSAAGSFVAPLGNGLCHGGATHYAAARPLPPLAAWESLREALSWLPGMAGAELCQIWTGVRVALQPDREPVAGPVPGQAGLWVMAGFSTRGLLLIPSAAEALADSLMGRPDLTPAWMRPDRLPASVWQ